MVRVSAQAEASHLFYLSFEALAEDVVDHRIVYSGAFCKHARQQTDFRWDGATVMKNGPQAHQAIRCPAAYEACTDQDSNLQQSGRIKRVKIQQDVCK